VTNAISKDLKGALYQRSTLICVPSVSSFPCPVAPSRERNASHYSYNNILAMEQLLSPFAYAVSLVFFASGLRNLGLLRVRFRSMKVLKLKWIRCFVFASRPRTMRILGSLQCKIQ